MASPCEAVVGFRSNETGETWAELLWISREKQISAPLHWALIGSQIESRTNVKLELGLNRFQLEDLKRSSEYAVHLTMPNCPPLSANLTTLPHGLDEHVLGISTGELILTFAVLALWLLLVRHFIVTVERVMFLSVATPKGRLDSPGPLRKPISKEAIQSNSHSIDRSGLGMEGSPGGVRSESFRRSPSIYARTLRPPLRSALSVQADRRIVWKSDDSILMRNRVVHQSSPMLGETTVLNGSSSDGGVGNRDVLARAAAAFASSAPLHNHQRKTSLRSPPKRQNALQRRTSFGWPASASNESGDSMVGLAPLFPVSTNPSIEEEPDDSAPLIPTPPTSAPISSAPIASSVPVSVPLMVQTTPVIAAPRLPPADVRRIASYLKAPQLSPSQRKVSQVLLGKATTDIRRAEEARLMGPGFHRQGSSPTRALVASASFLPDNRAPSLPSLHTLPGVASALLAPALRDHPEEKEEDEEGVESGGSAVEDNPLIPKIIVRKPTSKFRQRRTRMERGMKYDQEPGSMDSYHTAKTTPDLVCSAFTIPDASVAYDPAGTGPYNPLTVATITCDPGYALTAGSVNSTCDAGIGNWTHYSDAVQPTCSQVCDEEPGNQTLLAYSADPYVDGTVATFSCPGTMVLEPDVATATCSSQAWSVPTPDCVPTCPAITPTDGSFNTSDPRRAMGSTASLICDPGHKADAGVTDYNCMATSLTTADWDPTVNSCDAYDPCDDSPCEHNGTCTGTFGTGIYTCDCPVGYNGTNCEDVYVIDWCADEPCANNATCNAYPSGYNCTCPLGWSGDNCTILEDPCSVNGTSPCVFGNCTASPDLTSFNCTCEPDFTGTLCDKLEVYDYCAAEPCQNNGTCDSDSSGFWCNCTQGWTGSNCSVPLCDGSEFIPFLLEGSMTFSNWAEPIPGYTISFACDYNDTETLLVGPTSTVCLDNGTWSEPAPPMCMPICPEVSMTHGSVVYTNETRIVGTNATFSCDDAEYAIDGNPVAVCEKLPDNSSLADWTELPTCRRILCIDNYRKRRKQRENQGKRIRKSGREEWKMRSLVILNLLFSLFLGAEAKCQDNNYGKAPAKDIDNDPKTGEPCQSCVSMTAGGFLSSGAPDIPMSTCFSNPDICVLLKAAMNKEPILKSVDCTSLDGTPQTPKDPEQEETGTGGGSGGNGHDGGQDDHSDEKTKDPDALSGTTPTSFAATFVPYLILVSFSPFLTLLSH